MTKTKTTTADEQSPQRNKSTEKSARKTDNIDTNTSEYGGPKGLEPTRYGDWEKAGRCIDF